MEAAWKQSVADVAAARAALASRESILIIQGNRTDHRPHRQVFRHRRALVHSPAK
jgi:hypothetical protein